jgi:hypothetical protein
VAAKCIEVREPRFSGGWPPSTIDRHYRVEGTNDEAQAAGLFYGKAPQFYHGLIRDADACEITHDGYELWSCKAHYRRPDPAKYPELTPEDLVDSEITIVEFDTSGATQHITQAISQTDHGPVRYFEIAASRAIGVTQDDVLGVDIVVPVMNFTVKKKWNYHQFNADSALNIYARTGKVNSDVVTIGDMQFQPGELLFGGGSGGVVQSHWEISYTYFASPNRRNLAISPAINVPAKKGHEYLWVLYRRDKQDNRFVQTPEAAFVSKVYEEEPLNGVFGF